MARHSRQLVAVGKERMSPVVVEGLDSITGLQTARILSRHGVPVIGVVASRRHWGTYTNACVEVVESANDDDLVTCLQHLGRRLQSKAVLMPCTDRGVDTLSRNRELLEDRFVLALGSHAVVEMLMDKVKFTEYAVAAGLPIPRTELLYSRSDAERAAAVLSYPCVLKPPLKTVLWASHTKAKAFSVESAAQLLSTYDRVAEWSDPLLAQEWVAGGEDALFSCNGYFNAAGKPLVTFVARKVRQWPPGVGTSASGVECRNDQVLDTTLRIFGGLRFHGLAYLEMKRDARSGELMIIEPNVGRPTGRSAIAEAGGVELVYTAYCDAVGLPLPPNRQQRYVGAKWLDVRRDVQAAIVANRQGTLTFRQWLRSIRGPKAHAIWAPHDPLPFAVDLAQASRVAAARMFGRAATSDADRPPVSARSKGVN